MWSTQQLASLHLLLTLQQHQERSDFRTVDVCWLLSPLRGLGKLNSKVFMAPCSRKDKRKWTTERQDTMSNKPSHKFNNSKLSSPASLDSLGQDAVLSQVAALAGHCRFAASFSNSLSTVAHTAILAATKCVLNRLFNFFFF